VRIETSVTPHIATPKVPAPSQAPASSPAAVKASSLADVLTPEEREYFARMEQMGPLSYGRRPAVAPPAADAPRGQRIDFRA
jgi:hypothetical protein